jgi:hypothetical protein
MTVAPASPADVAGFLLLAAEVEEWFGPMVGDDGFRAALANNIGREAPAGPEGGSRQWYHLGLPAGDSSSVRH